MTSNKIILDCDPGEDDALAILLALAKDIDVSALVCGFGNTSANITYCNGANLLALGGRTDITLYKGAEQPYRPHPIESGIVSAGDFVGENGLCGVVLPKAPDHMLRHQHIAQADRVRDIVAHIKNSGSLTYIITGPCTTFAHVLDELANEVKD